MNLCLDIKQNKLIADQWGEMHSSSRCTDMLCEAQAQYGDYSELDECPMWGNVGEGRENELLDDIDFDRYGKVLCSKIEQMLPKLMKMMEGEEKFGSCIRVNG